MALTPQTMFRGRSFWGTTKGWEDHGPFSLTCGDVTLSRAHLSITGGRHSACPVLGPHAFPEAPGADLTLICLVMA